MRAYDFEDLEKMEDEGLEPLPLDAVRTENPDAPKHPLAVFDLRTPEQIKEQIKMAEDTAKFFKTHWLFFYLSVIGSVVRFLQRERTLRGVNRLLRKEK